MFAEGFSDFVCEGDSISYIAGFEITARIVRDDCPDAPDERQDGFWHLPYKDALGFIGPGPNRCSSQASLSIVSTLAKVSGGDMLQQKRDVSQCRIEAKSPELRPRTSNPSSYQCEDESDKPIGCFVAVVVAIGGFIFMANSDLPDDMSGWFWLVPIGGGIWAGLALISFIRDKRGKLAVLSENRNVEISNARARENAVKEAISKADRVRQQYQAAFRDLESIKAALRSVDACIVRAEQEYRQNAFSPFWDEIENAVQTLSKYGDEVKALGQSASYYALTLQGETHDFPPYPISESMIPDAMVTAEDLRRVIRLGHTNYEFASIWEQRKNREVMIAGFNCVADAVNGIEGLVLEAVRSCEGNILAALRKMQSSLQHRNISGV